jgi:hypothetical protein
MMKRLALPLICAVTAFVGGSFGQTAKDPFSITISADKPTVVAGSRVYVRIKLTNTSDHVVDCSTAMVGAFDRRYLYDVLDENGKSMIKTDIGPERYPGSYQFCNLDPGESTGNGERSISWLYDLTKPGTYTVQVSGFIGNDEKQGVIKSNTITITVVAPEPSSEEAK